MIKTTDGNVINRRRRRVDNERNRVTKTCYESASVDDAIQRLNSHKVRLPVRQFRIGNGNISEIYDVMRDWVGDLLSQMVLAYLYRV